MCRIFAFAATVACIVIASPAQLRAQDKSIVVASTTSTQDSGLFGYILPIFKAKTGIDVKVIAQGTGQALETGRRGDADVLFVHAKAQEEKFVADGYGVKRFDVMYNDFVLVGPKEDPAGLKGGHEIVAALKTIYEKQVPFVSRGDKSGTHTAELNLWKAAGLDPAAQSPPGTAPLGRAWEQRSTPRGRWALICCPIAARGSPSRTRTPCRSSSKATNASSTSTASYWSTPKNSRA